MENKPYASIVSIINGDDYKNKTGPFAKKVLEPNVLTELFRRSQYSVSVRIYINIIHDGEGLINNLIPSPAKVKIWVSDKKSPTREDLYDKVTMTPEADYNRGAIIMGKNEAVFALTDTEGLVIRIDGVDERTRG